MSQKRAWEITDEFWEEVKDVLIRKGREEKRRYKRKAGGSRNPKDFRMVVSYCWGCGTGGLDGTMTCGVSGGNGKAERGAR